MAIILPRAKTFGQSAMEGLGTGLGSGLQALANMKLQQMQKQQERKKIIPGLTQIFGSEKAESYADLDPTILRELVKQEMQIPAQTAYAEAINRMSGRGQQQGMDQQQGGGQEQQLTGVPTGIQPIPARLTERQTTELAKMQQRENLAERKMSHQDRSKNKEFNRKFKSDIFKEENKELGNSVRNRKMQQLTESGKVDDPSYFKLMKKMGLDFLLSKETISYEKLVADSAQQFAANTKGKITEKLFKEYLKSLPSLDTSVEARRDVEDIRSSLGRANLDRAKLTRDIIREKGNIETYDLEDLVSEQMIDVYKNIENKLLQGIEKNRSQSNFFETLPPASENKGAEAIDHNTGKTLVSNGVEWKEK